MKRLSSSADCNGSEEGRMPPKKRIQQQLALETSPASQRIQFFPSRSLKSKTTVSRSSDSPLQGREGDEEGEGEEEGGGDPEKQLGNFTTQRRSSGTDEGQDQGQDDEEDEDSTSKTNKGNGNSSSNMPGGLILQGGRVRLPDKLFEYLCKRVAFEVLYWQTGGESFTFDSKNAQKELLDKYFNGMKLTSFTRSLNRWGFKRIFQSVLPRNLITYTHPLFKRDNPELLKELKMTNPDKKPAAAGTGDEDNKDKDKGRDRQVSRGGSIDRKRSASKSPSRRNSHPQPLATPAVPSSVVLPASAQASAAASLPGAAGPVGGSLPLVGTGAISANFQQGGTSSLLNPALWQNLSSDARRTSEQPPNTTSLHHGEPNQQQQSQQDTALNSLLANTQGQTLTRDLQLRQLDTPGLLSLLTQPQPQQEQQTALSTPSQAQHQHQPASAGIGINDILRAVSAQGQQSQPVQFLLHVLAQQQLQQSPHQTSQAQQQGSKNAGEPPDSGGAGT